MNTNQPVVESIEIVHVISSLEVGGAEQMLKRLLLSDPHNKKKIVIISLRGIGLIGKQLQAAGYAVYGLNFCKLATIFTQWRALIQLLKPYPSAIIQTWMYHADFFGGIAAKLAGCSYIVWGVRCTDIPRSNRRTYLIMRLCALFSHIIPKKIICVAEAAKANHHDYGYCFQKMHVISNGFNFAELDPSQVNGDHFRTQYGLRPEDFVIGCVGRFHVDKGQDVLIQAAQLIEQDISVPIVYLFIGRGCDSNNLNLQKQIHDLGLKARFLLLGERLDIPQCLAAMNVFCMPSRTEGFPNGLGEAMAMGVPCVASNVGDVQVLTGAEALLVPANDPIILAETLKRIINQSPLERKNLGLRAAKRIRAHFSIDNCREQYYLMYRDVKESVS